MSNEEVYLKSMVLTATYVSPLAFRSLNTSTDSDVRHDITRAIEDDHNIHRNISAMSELSGKLLRLGDPSLEIPISNGYDTKRYNFVLIIQVKNRLRDQIVTHEVHGYTDSGDMYRTRRGGESLDLETIMYINDIHTSKRINRRTGNSFTQFLSNNTDDDDLTLQTLQVSDTLRYTSDRHEDLSNHNANVGEPSRLSGSANLVNRLNPGQSRITEGLASTPAEYATDLFRANLNSTVTNNMDIESTGRVDQWVNRTSLFQNWDTSTPVCVMHWGCSNFDGTRHSSSNGLPAWCSSQGRWLR